MKAQLDDFKTGWFGLSLGLKRHEVEVVIASFERLIRSGEGHFHAHSKFSGSGGIGDIEFSLIPDDSEDELEFDEDD